VAETIGNVIIYHTGGLHVSIHYRGADEGEAALFHIFADSVGYRAGGGQVFEAAPFVLDGTAIDEPPDVLGKAAEFLLDLQKSTSIGPSAEDLEPVANNAGILQ